MAALVGLSYTARTYRVTEQGHITDRYTKAIDQLGSTRLDVRLGGIYALERIAVDSIRDHPTVVEVLSAYIRQHSDSTPTTRHPTLPLPAPAPTGGRPRRGAAQPAGDVQAAVTVLGRLPARHGVPRGDLTGAQLTGTQLKEVDLTGAWLSKANLTRAWLEGANLTGARLSEGNLSRAWLRGADLTRAVLKRANLSGVDLTTTKGLTQQRLESADGDERTRLPSDCQRPAHWPAGSSVD